MDPESNEYEVIGGPLDGIRAGVTTRLCACCGREFITVHLPLSCADAVNVNRALHQYVFDDVLKRMTWPAEPGA